VSEPAAGEGLLACAAVDNHLWMARQSDWIAIDGGFNQNPQSRHLMMCGAMEWSSVVRKL